MKVRLLHEKARLAYPISDRLSHMLDNVSKMLIVKGVVKNVKIHQQELISSLLV